MSPAVRGTGLSRGQSKVYCIGERMQHQTEVEYKRTERHVASGWRKRSEKRRKPPPDYRQRLAKCWGKEKEHKQKKDYKNIRKASRCQASSLSASPVQNPRAICSQFLQIKRVFQNPSVGKDRAQVNYCFTTGLEALAVQALVYLTLFPE